MSGGWCWLSVGTMWVTGPHIFGRPAPVYSDDRVLRVPRGIKRGRAQCRSTSQVSASTMFFEYPTGSSKSQGQVQIQGVEK